MKTMNGTEFADFCGVSKASVSAWTQDGMPHKNGGRAGRQLEISPAAAIPWVIAHREAPEGSQRERLAKVQADKFEIDNARRRGELIYTWQVADALNSMAAQVSASLDALPGRVSSELAGLSDAGQIRARLLDECRGVRAEVARHVSKLADAGEAVANQPNDLESASEEVGGSVGGRKKGAAAGKRRAGSVAQ